MNGRNEYSWIFLRYSVQPRSIITDSFTARFRTWSQNGTFTAVNKPYISVISGTVLRHRTRRRISTLKRLLYGYLRICDRPMWDSGESEIRLGQSGISHWTSPIWNPTLDWPHSRPISDQQIEISPIRDSPTKIRRILDWPRPK